LSALNLSAQDSDFLKNYVGLFYSSGYYYQVEQTNFGPRENSIDFHTVGVTAARRLTQNFYVQTNAFSANGQYFYIDLGVKANFLVHHQLQPTGSFSFGSRLGIEKASNTYYGFGLDWHIAPNIVLNGTLNSDLTGYTSGLRFGGSYKF
jgi:hypothetical protein